MDDKDRKIAHLEQELKELKNIFHTIPAHIYWKDHKGIVLGCNQVQAQTLGFHNADDVIGKTMYDLFPKEIAEQIIAVDQEVINSQEKKVVEEYSPASYQGDLTTYLSIKLPIQYQHKQPPGLLGISIDIGNYKLAESQLKKSHEEVLTKNRLVNIFLDNILEHAPICFYWLDKKHRILGCNSMQAKLFGLKNSDDLIGKNLYDIAAQSGHDATAVQQMQNGNITIIETGIPYSLEEKKSINGEQRFFLTYKNPLCDSDNKVIGIFAFSFEITDRKKVEQLLTKTNDELQRLNKAKTEFIRNMEHDIRTPLAGIQMLSHELTSLDQKYRNNLGDFLEQISDSAKGLIDYCNRILDYSRAESTDTANEPQKASVKDLFGKVLAIQQPIAISKQIGLKLFINDDVPNDVFIDDYRLQRVLVNLVSNAIKFTNKGEVNFGIRSFESISENAGILTIYVQDTGIGIPADKLDYIFERFSQLSSNESHSYKGQGLGLSIVKKFVSDLNGSIHVTSEVNQGTIFDIKLPVKLAT